jgi:tetratricopeptide (TPR) repeat protein
MRILALILLLACLPLSAQNAILAKQYYKKGEFEKALFEYKKLYRTSKSSISYITQIIDIHQQLEQYQEAEDFILDILARTRYSAFYVNLGYNYQLKGEVDKADENYAKAINSINDNPNNVYAVVRNFQEYALLDQTAAAYEKAMVLKPQLNLKLSLAQIYGEQGKLDKMMLNYVDFIERNPVSLSNVKRAINDFISEDSSNPSNAILRKLLIKKIQQEPNIIWNEMLSWLFIQQKEYNKAFTQEKAIFARQPERLSRIMELGEITNKVKETSIALEIFNYVIEKAQSIETKLDAHYALLEIQTLEANPREYNEIAERYLDVFNTYGKFSQTFKLQIAYAHFLAFYQDKTKEASTFLEAALELPLNKIQKAEIKLELGDILVLQEKFDKALIYYTQIQRNLKNSTVSQKARFRVAKASYYKGDFKWAEAQLKILKSSTSQLIANDALDLKLLITDNKYEDSLQVALKKYAKADLLAFQNKNDAAIALLRAIIDTHKTEPIIPQALFKQGQLFEKKKNYEAAADNYQNIIDNHSDSILADNAIYNLAELYLYKLEAPEKAKTLYKTIVFQHADSIYYIEARKRFRQLRGDAIN